MNNVGKGRRVLSEDLVTMICEHKVGTRKGHRREKKKMSWQKYLSYFTQPEHGGYTKDQLSVEWTKKLKGGNPIDKNGVIDGESGYIRFEFDVSSDDISTFSDDFQMRLAGNSVHVPTVGAVLVWALSSGFC